MKNIFFASIITIAFCSSTVLAAVETQSDKRAVLVSATLLDKLKMKAVAKDMSIDVAYAILSEKEQAKLSQANHEAGKCGGFEALPSTAIFNQEIGLQALAQLKKQVDANHVAALKKKILKLEKKPEIEKALSELKEENLRSTVEWLSTYPNRDNRAANPNVHVDAMEQKLKGYLQNYKSPWTIQQIAHQSTRQKSLRVHLEGKTKASEIIVLGGHLDSINQSWSGGSAAPGADDNASGSANLVEALRVMIQKGQPERSIEFFWYAGEESGLLGSAEIARQYKRENKDVIAVLQLDMTMFPGAGEFVVGNVSDFTSAWLREYLVALNDAYLNIRFVDDQCGYACSDHASWFRQGYPTLMPFESDTDRMNSNIHTTQDIIDNGSSFRHSLVFSKIALAFAMDLGNSNIRQP